MIPVESPFAPGAVMFPTGVTPRFHEFYDSLASLHVPEGCARLRLGGPDCDTNRNRALRVLPDEARWVFFLDDDQSFSPDTLMRLLYTMYGSHGIDAVTGLYTKKKPPFSPVLFKTNPPGSELTFGRFTLDELAEIRRTSGPVIRVGACGGGMLLVKRETLDLIGDPWFSPGPGRGWGGDIGFCGAMLHSGLKLFADLGVAVGHVVPSAVTPIWDEAKQEWSMKFEFGDGSFLMSASHFQEPARA